MATPTLTKHKVHTRYFDDFDVDLPSATQVTGLIAKQGLLWWYHNCGRDGLKPNEVSKTEANKGTLAHYRARCYMWGEPVDESYLAEFSDIEREGAEVAFQNFLVWTEGKTIVPKLTEEPLVSNLFGYGGTPDFIGTINGVMTLVDYKTGSVFDSKSGELYKEIYYQVCAYRQLARENNSEYQCQQCIVLHMPKDNPGTYQEKIITDFEPGWQAFMAVRARPIWYDEAFAIIFSGKGLAAMLAGTLTPDATVRQPMDPPTRLLHAAMGLECAPLAIPLSACDYSPSCSGWERLLWPGR